MKLYGVRKRNVRQDWELIFDTIKLNPNHSFLFLDALPPNHVGHKSLGEKLTATNQAECLSERYTLISSTSKLFHIKNGLPMVCLTPLVSLLIVQKEMRLRIGKWLVSTPKQFPILPFVSLPHCNQTMLDASEWARSSQPIIKHNVGRRDALDVIMFKAALYQKQDTLCNGDPSMSSTAQEVHSRRGSMWLCRNNRALSHESPDGACFTSFPILFL